MTWTEIRKPDGRRWRRSTWPAKRWIWFAPSYVLVHWEEMRNSTKTGESYNVGFYDVTKEDRDATDWEELPK